jgi:hypothetical protein
MLESQALGIRVPDAMSIARWDDIEIMKELRFPSQRFAFRPKKSVAEWAGGSSRSLKVNRR